MARDVPRGHEGAELLEGQGGHRAAGRAVKRAPAGRRVDHTTKRSHPSFLELLDPRDKSLRFSKRCRPGYGTETAGACIF